MSFQTICRVCIGKNSGMVSIFESYNFSEHKREIFKVITDCASVQIRKFDGFSEQICRRCLDRLSQAYSFKKLCEDSDYKFRNNLIIFDNIEIKTELVEEEATINYGDDLNVIAEDTNEMIDVGLTQVKTEFAGVGKIETYTFEDETNEETVSISNKTRRKKRMRDWKMVATFNTKEEATSAVNSEEIWSFHYRNNTSDGNKAYYRCNKVKRKERQCNAGLYLLFNNQNESVAMFRANEEHSHENLEQQTKLSNQMKEEIKKLFDLKVKPKKMFEILIEKGLRPKNKPQLSNYLVQLRQQNKEQIM